MVVRGRREQLRQSLRRRFSIRPTVLEMSLLILAEIE